MSSSRTYTKFGWVGYGDWPYQYPSYLTRLDDYESLMVPTSSLPIPGLYKEPEPVPERRFRRDED